MIIIIVLINTIIYFLYKVLWGGWWQEGAARSTGEEVEQINSYISRCGSTTKHMCPEGSRNVTDFLLCSLIYFYL